MPMIFSGTLDVGTLDGNGILNQTDVFYRQAQAACRQQKQREAPCRH